MAVAVETYIPWHSVASVTRIAAKLMLLLAFGYGSISTSNLFAYTPASPQVKRIIEKGVAFLCSENSDDSRSGGQALAALALLKADVQPDHPKILKAVEMVRKTIPENDPRKCIINEIYTTGISIIFLITLDPAKYQPEIDCLLRFLYAKQKSHGGWGYLTDEIGDTSMTQYGVLSSWEAKQAGYAVPAVAMNGVGIWLLQTQDPSGGFGYQAVVPSDGKLMPQREVRHSLTAAGGGCLYILADLFQSDMEEKKADGVPAALKGVKFKESKRPSSLQTDISAAQLRESQLRTSEWMKNHYSIENYIINPDNSKIPFHYEYYYLYALERYMSFRDLVERTSEKEPKWYNDGVRYMLKHQSADGSFEDHCSKTTDTAFAILFLVRSTKKAIEKVKNLGAGVAIGGRGLPKPGERHEIQGGVLVVKQDVVRADDLLEMLDDSKEVDYGKALELMSELPSQQVESLLSAHGDKLRQLTRDQEPDARMAAVVALGKTRNLDNVPALVFALTDPDREVVIEARKALERVSRNPAGFGPKDDYKEEDRQTAIKKWKAWYLSLRPDADADF